MKSRLLDDLERLLARGLEEDARRAGVRAATARVLLALGADEEVPMGALADRIGRDASTATRFVDRAAAEGLVERRPGLDRRRRLARLTEAGSLARERLERFRGARSVALPVSIRAQTGLGDEEVEWFLSALVKALA